MKFLVNFDESFNQSVKSFVRNNPAYRDDPDCFVFAVIFLQGSCHVIDSEVNVVQTKTVEFFGLSYKITADREHFSSRPKTEALSKSNIRFEPALRDKRPDLFPLV